MSASASLSGSWLSRVWTSLNWVASSCCLVAGDFVGNGAGYGLLGPADSFFPDFPFGGGELLADGGGVAGEVFVFGAEPGAEGLDVGGIEGLSLPVAGDGAFDGVSGEEGQLAGGPAGVTAECGRLIWPHLVLVSAWMLAPPGW